jgi:hypothetical protein
VIPLVAFAETSVKLDGSVSVNSLPGLSSCGDVLVFESVTVYVIELPGAKVPKTAFVPLTFAGD